MGLVIRVTDIVITAIRVTDTGIIRMGTPDHIRTTAITGAPRTLGTTGIAFTATTAITTTGIGNKLGVGRRSNELAWKRFRASFFFINDLPAIPQRLWSQHKR